MASGALDTGPDAADTGRCEGPATTEASAPIWMVVMLPVEPYDVPLRKLLHVDGSCKITGVHNVFRLTALPVRWFFLHVTKLGVQGSKLEPANSA